MPSLRKQCELPTRVSESRKSSTQLDRASLGRHACVPKGTTGQPPVFDPVPARSGARIAGTGGSPRLCGSGVKSEGHTTGSSAVSQARMPPDTLVESRP